MASLIRTGFPRRSARGAAAGARLDGRLQHDLGGRSSGRNWRVDQGDLISLLWPLLPWLLEPVAWLDPVIDKPWISPVPVISWQALCMRLLQRSGWRSGWSC